MTGDRPADGLERCGWAGTAVFPAGTAGEQPR